MLNLGTVKPGTTIYIPFSTYDSNDPTQSVTITGLATTDIEVYKNGGTTARASDSGYALLGTDGVDEYGTGIHGFSIDLADNTTSGFYVAGAQYWVVVASITVDGGTTVNFIAATFRIGYPDAMLDTTIAAYTSQTSFTLTAGPAEDDALNGCVVCIHDLASAVQCGFAVISDYVGSSKTVTLTAGTTFTIAAGDNISIFPPANARWLGATAQTAGDVPALVATVDGVVDNIHDTDLPAVKTDTAAILVDTGTDGVVVATGSKTGYELSSTGNNAAADALLKRDWSGLTGEAARSVLNALRFLRNKWSISGTTLTVTKEDDATSAWTSALTESAGANPISASDPA